MAGYSGTSLPRKLGIKPGMRVGLSNAPRDLRTTLGALPEDVLVIDADVGSEPFDILIVFATTARELSAMLRRLPRRLDPAGGLWIGWPKKASGVKTDVTETVVRERGLATGLVDNKVCAIDDTWSGLRFVVRRANRPPRRKGDG